jgi:hypothetical protein
VANNFYSDKKGRYEIKPVTIETVDQAAVDYFDKKLNVHVDTERGRSKVSVMYASGERWKLIRKNNFRDENGTLILPIISVRRTDIDRTPGFGGMAQEVPEITVSSVIHPKTSNVQNLLRTRQENKHFPSVSDPKASTAVVREYLTLPFPDFCTIYYEVSIWTQYQTQMNDILEKIFYKYEHMDQFVMPVEYDGKLMKGNSYYFVGFREGNVTPQSNVEDFTDQERIIKYAYAFKTPVYLILDPKDEALAYEQGEAYREGEYVEGDQGKKVVYKTQSAINVKLSEESLSLEEFEKLFG